MLGCQFPLVPWIWKGEHISETAVPFYHSTRLHILEPLILEKVCRSSKWWEVKNWGESVSELMILKKKKQLQETVHSTVLLGCFYLLYML